MQARTREALRAQAEELVKRGRDARSVMGNPVVQEHFISQLALAFEEFVTLDIRANPTGLTVLHLKTQAMVALMDHLEQGILAGQAAEENLRKQEE